MIQVLRSNEIATASQSWFSSSSHHVQEASPPKKSLICSVCQHLWCKYTHQWGVQGANMMFLTGVGMHMVHSLSQYKRGPADPPCPPVFSSQESLVMRAQDPGRPNSASG